MTDAGAVSIRSIAAGGDGVGTLPDGMVVFVPRAAPGDVLSLKAVERHGRLAHAEIDQIIAGGPDRVAPPCPHYVADRCGGCQLMHLAASAQRASRATIIGDAVRRLGRMAWDDPPIRAAAAELGYRTRITLTVTPTAIGYHRLGQAGRVFPLAECLLAEPAIRRLFAAVRPARHLLPRDADRLVLRRDRAGGLHVSVITTGRAAWTGAEVFHAALVSAGAAATIWWQPEGGAARAVAGAETPWPVTVFEQVHPAMANLVREAAVAALGEVDGVAVWDLYAGIGETSAALAARGARVVSVEVDSRAVELAATLGPDGVDRRAGRAEDLAARLPPAVAVVLNPPRVGAAAGVTAALVKGSARRVVYVSCDPATLARDLRRLAPAYRLADLVAFDQFPQTAHVETLAVLDRA